MTVTLTISDETGIPYPAISTTIQIMQRSINVSYPGGDNQSMTVNFSTPTSSYITNYRWDYGDGTFDTGAPFLTFSIRLQRPDSIQSYLLLLLMMRHLFKVGRIYL